MNKHRYTIKLIIEGEADALEAVENFLFEQGAAGSVEQEKEIVVYFPDSFEILKLNELLTVYIQSLRSMGLVLKDPLFERIPWEDWSQKWRENFQAIAVTPRLVVKPPWKSWKKKDQQILLNITPRMAFGTGSHETTRICLSFLDEIVWAGCSMLDMGAGSGILAIAAVKLGAESATAVEIDEDSIVNAHENCYENGVSDAVDIHLGSIEAVPNQHYDIIASNMIRSSLQEMIPHLSKWTHNESFVILSGVLETEEAWLNSAILDSGMAVQRKKQMGEWLGFLLRPIRDERR